ncbi:MAG: alpha/beta hydrolase [Heteroscytonema crispum UTEX LB 1556]
MRQSWRSLKIVAGFFWAIALTQFFAPNTSARAADTVVVRFGAFAESISLAELQTTAETGKFPESFDIYTRRLSEQQRRQILGALRTNMPINVVTMSKLLNTHIGTTILNDLSTVIIRKDNASTLALRAGLVLGATAPQGLSVLTFIAAYPSERLEIDLPQAFKVAENLNKSFSQTQ